MSSTYDDLMVVATVATDSTEAEVTDSTEACLLYTSDAADE